MDDAGETGGKHTIAHVRRSMEFAAQYCTLNNLPEEDCIACQTMICCTDLDYDLDTLRWPSRGVELLGKIVATADLLAQMADRAHLEKLFYLYQEFQEGMVSGYNSAEDLLRKTINFYGLVRFMASHFSQRWGIQDDLYRLAIENEEAYLRNIMRLEDQEMRRRLRRKGIVNKLSDKTAK
jgi:hypothetical protein